MSAEITLVFPQTAQSLARHAARGVDDAIEFIAKAQGAAPFQVRGDMQDGYYTDAQIITLAKKIQSLGIEVRQWSTYSFYDYNPLADLERMVNITERERNKRPARPLAVVTAG